MNQFVFENKRPVVKTRGGKLRGITYGGVNIFMGVEYARARRFHMPEEIQPWEGIKNAWQHGPVAMQAMPINPFFYHRGIHVVEKESEDCQNLNIWAPVCGEEEKKPVFVWIHGGGFFGGNAYEEISFDGFRMAHYGDVVFVSINHRLNIAGHLNLEDYGEEFSNSGNAGIADLVMAMKWIHENIAFFGGDPENVTICGHSGGGGKVQCLYQIEEAVPYFQRGICLSGARAGTGSPCDTRENSRKTAKAVLDELGITKDSIDKIYDIPYSDLVEATMKTTTPFSFSPIINDYFPGFPGIVDLMPFSKDKPIIYSSVIAELPPRPLTFDEREGMDEAAMTAYLKNCFGEHAEELIRLFRESYPDHDIIDLAYMDSGYRLAAQKSAMKHLEAGCENVYLMLPSYTVPENGRIPIWHGGEVAYIFMNEDKVLVLNDAENGQKYASALSSLVLNYVKTGDPNCEYLPKWEKFTRENNYTMIIDKEFRCVTHHDDELIDLLWRVGPKPAFPFPKKKK